MTIHCNTFREVVAATQTYGHLLTPFQASEDFGCCRQYVYKLLASEKCDRVIVFGVLMVGRSDLAAQLSSCLLTHYEQVLELAGPEIPE